MSANPWRLAKYRPVANCSHCDAGNPNDSLFCVECGRQLFFETLREYLPPDAQTARGSVEASSGADVVGPEADIEATAHEMSAVSLAASDPIDPTGSGSTLPVEDASLAALDPAHLPDSVMPSVEQSPLHEFASEATLDVEPAHFDPSPEDEPQTVVDCEPGEAARLEALAEPGERAWRPLAAELDAGLVDLPGQSTDPEDEPREAVGRDASLIDQVMSTYENLAGLPVEGYFPEPNDVIGGYEILEEIGRGGMGRVYRGRHAVTGQEVALKMLVSQGDEEYTQRRRFINEAQVLATLEHENLVPMLGFIEEPIGTFIVMKYVKGITLEQMLYRQGRLSPRTALGLFEQICLATDHVHRNKVMHRDLKPSNVIVREDGTVAVTDFGIARPVGSDQLTLTGMVVGTAEYVAPEQACGESRDDLRSDIYALGVMLYEMVTGQVPFRHPSPAEVLRRHVAFPPPPPRVILPELPQALEDALLKSLEKSPDDRFQSVEAFQLAVVNAIRGRVPRMAGPQPKAAAAVAAAQARGASSPDPSNPSRSLSLRGDITSARAPSPSWQKPALIAAVVAALGGVALLVVAFL